MEIAPYFRASDWRQLKLDNSTAITADWKTAIDAFESRIKVRFFDPVHVLIDAEKDKMPKRFGFAILAIDCLLIETLQAFYDGIVDHNRKSQELFTAFLRRWDTFKKSIAPSEIESSAKLFYIDIRCALHHSGATGPNCRVTIFGEPVTIIGNEIKINRTKLHAELEKAFMQYLSQLRDPANSALREKFKSKMDAICA